MDLASQFASARAVYLGGRRHWVRPLSLDARGTVQAWLDDRGLSPSPADPESWAALSSGPGLGLLIWLALRDQGVTSEAADALAGRIEAGEVDRLAAVLFARRRSFRPPEAKGRDLTEVWWGTMLCRFPDLDRRIAGGLLHAYPALTLEAVGRLTLDQLECLMSGGLEDEQPGAMMHGIDDEPPQAVLERLRREHPDVAARLDEQLRAQGDGEAI